MAQVLGDIFEGWLETLKSEGKLAGESLPELPPTIMWVRALLGQHYDLLGNTVAALEQLDAAIAHAPTLPDLYMLKARVYKHAGALEAASDWMDQARRMDLADRYLNTKATRYMLRADQLDEAQKTIAVSAPDQQKVSQNTSHYFASSTILV